MDLDRLSDPFPRQSVHWRAQGQPSNRNGKYAALALAYLDARDVMDRLDSVCGRSGWQSHFDETPKGRVICRLSILVDGQWITKSDGAGDTDVEGEKGGISDALKRAAVSWGIGRYLYRLQSPWVPCEVTEKNGKVYWKKWAADPWAMVRGEATAEPKDQPAEPPKQDAQGATDNEVEATVNAIAALANLDALRTYWSKLYTDQRHVADHPKVIAAKEARKTALSPKEAA